jgi:hypothetical protein
LTDTEHNFSHYLREKLSAYYNIFEEAPMACDFMAVFNQRNAAYALKKDFEYYAFENNEVILYTESKDIETLDFDMLTAQIDATHHEMIRKNDDHMSSSIYLVYTVTEPLSKEIIKSIKKFKYYKSFKWGLEGWLNVGLVVINQTSGEGVSNRYGKKELERLLKLYRHYHNND